MSQSGTQATTAGVWPPRGRGPATPRMSHLYQRQQRSDAILWLRPRQQARIASHGGNSTAQSTRVHAPVPARPHFTTTIMAGSAGPQASKAGGGVLWRGKELARAWSHTIGVSWRRNKVTEPTSKVRPLMRGHRKLQTCFNTKRGWHSGLQRQVKGAPEAHTTVANGNLHDWGRTEASGRCGIVVYAQTVGAGAEPVAPAPSHHFASMCQQPGPTLLASHTVQRPGHPLPATAPARQRHLQPPVASNQASSHPPHCPCPSCQAQACVQPPSQTTHPTSRSKQK